MEEFTLIIKGFTSKAQLKAFSDWYSGQGEQDAAYWFESMKDEGELDCSFMSHEGDIAETDNSLTIQIKPM